MAGGELEPPLRPRLGIRQDEEGLARVVERDAHHVDQILFRDPLRSGQMQRHVFVKDRVLRAAHGDGTEIEQLIRRRFPRFAGFLPDHGGDDLIHADIRDLLQAHGAAQNQTGVRGGDRAAVIRVRVDGSFRGQPFQLHGTAQGQTRVGGGHLPVKIHVARFDGGGVCGHRFYQMRG